jgi:copper chaperone CopZ
MELSELEGVKSVEASEQNKTATVTFEPPATDESIKSLLTEINYPAVS